MNASTHTTSAEPDGTDVDRDALEREIDEARDALVDTVDAIAERVDPRQVASRNVEQLKREANRATEQAKQTSQEVQAKATAYVEENPDQVRTVVRGALATLVLVWFIRRRRRRRADS